MHSGVSRRDLLSVGAAGLSVGFAGCSAVEGFTSEPTELLFTLWNLDTQQPHQVFLEIYEADANDSEDGKVLEKDFELARAADTRGGEETNEKSSEDFRIESRPYLIRVYLPESEYPHTVHTFTSIPALRAILTTSIGYLSSYAATTTPTN